MPDVVAFADFVQSGKELCADLSARWRSYVPDRLEIFPYPNGAKLREMAVARFPDLVMWRVAGGGIIRTTDGLLSDRVLSSRLDEIGHPWSFKDSRRAWARFRDMPSDVARDQPMAGAWVTDVAGYFGSIDYHVLGSHLHGWRCDLDSVTVVMKMLAEWAKGGELRGLPIGPETSSVLGNAFLLPLDQFFMGQGLSHFRYMDDVVVIGGALQEEELARTVDRTLGSLGLRRNETKTRTFPAGMASEALQDMVLAYVNQRGEASRRRMEPGELLDLLEAEAENAYPSAKRLHSALGGLKDGAAVQLLTEHANLLNCDPRASFAYVAKHGLRNQTARDALMEAATRGGKECAASRLHALLACGMAPWGGSEGRVFASVATAENEYPAVRAQAWHASMHSPHWKPDISMEAADEERHPVIRRAIVLTLRNAPATPSKSAFLRKMAEDPYVKYAARWADVA